jgi:anthranilate phosphoribosyltransferase
MTYAELVRPLVERRDMTPEAAGGLMRYLIGGEATDAQIGGALLALRVKGCTTGELAAFVSEIRRHALFIDAPTKGLIDTCGTGGGIPSFNISTAAAFVAAGAGVRIAKHGNRAVTSTCGSADVLEALGVPTEGESEHLAHLLETTGLVFLYAPNHIPAMRHVARARRELGQRTVFNQLGPLLNPARADRQLIGVYDPGLMRSMGEALRLLGSQRAYLVHGMEGLDEISPVGPTEVVRVWEGRVSNETFTPETFGLDPVDPSALTPATDLPGAAAILKEAISDLDSPRARAVLPSAAAAIHLAGLAETLPEAANLARESVASGSARRKLDRMVQEQVL